MSSKGFVYHKQCLNCDECKARLDSGLVHPYEAPEGEGGGVFCKRCFVERFGEGGKPLTFSDTAVIAATDGSGENVCIGLAIYRYKSCLPRLFTTYTITTTTVTCNDT